MLKEVGIEPERVEMFNVAASDGPRFAEVVRLMDKRIRELGPSPLNDNYKKKAA
jgi:F420-non-reducing hydrogenase iron-sulfur subunit